MKIGYFVSKYPYNTIFPLDNYYCGGSILAASQLAGAISQSGHEVTVFTTSKDRSETIELEENLKIIRYSTTFKVLTSNISVNMCFNRYKENLDVVHTHFDLPPTPVFGYRYSKEHNVPLVLTYHGDWDYGSGPYYRRLGVLLYDQFLTRKILNHSSRIICPTEEFIDESKLLKSYKDKVSVIPNGIDLDSFQVMLSKDECRMQLNIPLDKCVILFVGSLYPHKGILHLVKAFKYVVEKCPDALLVVVGDGYLKTQLLTLSEKLEISENIIFSGYVAERELLVKYYHAADIFILPSFSESYGMVLLEAAVSELPMVVSDLNTFQWIIRDGYNGIVTAKGNETDISDALIYLIENESVRSEMGKHANVSATQYSWKNIAHKTEEIYQELVEFGR